MHVLQNIVFAAFMATTQRVIHFAREEGKYSDGIEEIHGTQWFSRGGAGQLLHSMAKGCLCPNIQRLRGHFSCSWRPLLIVAALHAVAALHTVSALHRH